MLPKQGVFEVVTRYLQNIPKVILFLRNTKQYSHLILILLKCRIGWAPNNASKWQMGFNLAFKGLSNISFKIVSLYNYTLLPATVKVLET
jgi:hypothetical protein